MILVMQLTVELFFIINLYHLKSVTFQGTSIWFNSTKLQQWSPQSPALSRCFILQDEDPTVFRRKPQQSDESLWVRTWWPWEWKTPGESGSGRGVHFPWPKHICAVTMIDAHIILKVSDKEVKVCVSNPCERNPQASDCSKRSVWDSCFFNPQLWMMPRNVHIVILSTQLSPSAVQTCCLWGAASQLSGPKAEKAKMLFFKQMMNWREAPRRSIK